MDLEKIIPQNALIELGGKEYELRKFTARDSVWAAEKYGSNERVEQIFSNLEIKEICQFIFRLLVDKSDFLPKKLKDYDDDGYEVDLTLTGPMRVAEVLVTQEQKYNALVSLLKTIGISMPEESEQESDLKKNKTKANPSKKSQPKK